MSLTIHEKDILKEYSTMCADEILYELDQSHAYLDAGYSSDYHLTRISELNLVLELRTETPNELVKQIETESKDA